MLTEFIIEFTPPGGKRLRLKVLAKNKEQAIEKLHTAIIQKTEVHTVQYDQKQEAIDKDMERQEIDFLNKIMGDK